MAGFGVKAKVTTAVTVFTALLVVLVLAGMLGLIAGQSSQANQNQLRSNNEDVYSELEVDEGLVIADDSVFVEDAVYSAVYSTSGHFLCGYMPSAELDNVSVAAGQVQQTGDWMVYDAEYNLDGYGSVRVRSVMDTQGSTELINNLWLFALVGVLLIAIIVALGSNLIMRRFLRPLDTINSTAAAISSGTDLSQRIKVSASRDEFYRLGSTFNGMLDRLERSFEKERRFSSNASHELRTPVAVILSEAEYALEGECDTGERQREALEKIKEQATFMSGLTNQLLMISRAERGDWNLQREEVDFSELVEFVSETGQELAAERNMKVVTHVEPDIMVLGDSGLLMRMVLNLLENAVRYGKEGGCIEVTLEEKDGFACGSVADDGRGIAADELPLIWERFYQADPSRSGANKGSGLGLSIVRFVAEAHGGTVHCVSELGHGSVFSFQIPNSRLMIPE